jgi:hypothetical protein
LRLLRPLRTNSIFSVTCDMFSERVDSAREPWMG